MGLTSASPYTIADRDVHRCPGGDRRRTTGRPGTRAESAGVVSDPFEAEPVLNRLSRAGVE
jgi:hypothetical protein